MRVTYPLLTRTLEVAVNFKNGNNRSREPEYRVFGKITLWKILRSDRELDAFTKIPGQCLTKPQSLFEYLTQRPENPLGIFMTGRLLPIGEKKALTIQELCLLLQRACTFFIDDLVTAVGNWKQLALELFCYVYTQSDYSPMYHNCYVSKGKLVNSLPTQPIQVALYIHLLHGLDHLAKARECSVKTAALDVAAFCKDNLDYALQDLGFLDRSNPLNYFFFVGLDELMLNR